MSITYTPTTNFGSKDSLPSNDPNKVIRGAEFTTEFTAIQSAFGLAAPASNPTFTGTATFDNVTASTVSLGSVTASSLTVNGAFTSPGIDDNANATAITINSSEHVGVGNPTPISKLDVYQSDPTKDISRLRLWGDTNNPMLLVSGNEADHSIDFRATGSTSGCDLSFTTSSIERMRITDLGRIGIGQTNPAHILDLKDANPVINMEHDAGGSSRIYFDDATDGPWGAINANYGSGGSSKEIKIAPNSAIGDARFGGMSVKKDVVKVGGDFQKTSLEVNDTIKVESTYPALDLRDTDATLGLGTRMVTSSDAFLMNALNSAGSYVQDIYKVNMNANGPTLHSWTTESAGTAMALSNGGTLGLGVTVPNNSGLMELQANSINGKSGSGLLMLTNTQSTVAAMTFNTTGNDYSIGSSGANIFNVYDITNATTPFAIDPNTPSSTMRLSSAGRVGIGTSSPAYTLEVEDSPTTTGAPQVAISAGASDVDGVLAFPLAGSSKGSIISNKPLTFHTGTTVNTANERMRIDNSGNVGIGTDAPQRPLHVNDVMRLEPRATAPTGASAGDIYFDSNPGGDAGILKCYDGSAWRNCF